MQDSRTPRRMAVLPRNINRPGVAQSNVMHINTTASRRRGDGRSTHDYFMLCVLEAVVDRDFREEGVE